MVETVARLPVCLFYLFYFHCDYIIECSLFASHELGYHILTRDIVIDRNRRMINKRDFIRDFVLNPARQPSPSVVLSTASFLLRGERPARDTDRCS